MKKLSSTVLAFLMVTAQTSVCAQQEKDMGAVADYLVGHLDLAPSDANKTYEQVLKPVLESGDNWHINTVDNGSLPESKLALSSQRFAVISIVNDNRFVTVTLIRFRDEGQVFYYVAETLPRTKRIAKKHLHELKESKIHKVLMETKDSASVEVTGHVSVTNMVFGHSGGGMQYVDANVIHLSGQ